MSYLSLTAWFVLVVGMSPASATADLDFPPSTASISYTPHPRDLVVIREEDGPYNVPDNARLIIYAVGATEFATEAFVTAGADNLLIRDVSHRTREIPPVPVESGTSVTVWVADGSFGPSHGRLLGYLVRKDLVPDISSVAFAYHPAYMVVLREGASFQVPSNARLVVYANGVGEGDGPWRTKIEVDGVLEFAVDGDYLGGRIEANPRLLIAGGRTVTFDTGRDGRLYAYLVPD